MLQKLAWTTQRVATRATLPAPTHRTLAGSTRLPNPDRPRSHEAACTEPDLSTRQRQPGWSDGQDLGGDREHTRHSWHQKVLHWGSVGWQFLFTPRIKRIYFSSTFFLTDEQFSKKRISKTCSLPRKPNSRKERLFCFSQEKI